MPGEPASGSGAGSSVSTVNVTYQRPSGSRETITIAGFSPVTSMPGHDHATLSGALALASHSSPSLMRNADRV